MGEGLAVDSGGILENIHGPTERSMQVCRKSGLSLDSLSLDSQNVLTPGGNTPEPKAPPDAVQTAARGLRRPSPKVNNMLFATIDSTDALLVDSVIWASCANAYLPLADEPEFLHLELIPLYGASPLRT